MPRRIDLTGQRFGYLTVQFRIRRSQCSKVYWSCSCDCGNTVEVRSYDLTSGHTQSCGCLRSKNLSDGIRYKHGLSFSHLYRVWASMISRTSNPNDKDYMNYGNRGIKVCVEWMNSFETFYAWAISHGYQEGLTIDRIDVNGNYYPENCRFVTRQVQANNKRETIRIIYGNISMTVSEAAKQYNIPRPILADRLRRGWTIQEAIELPPHAHRKKRK